MTWLKLFLERERFQVGWRFWLLFVVMTNLGFFPGLALESLLFGEVNVYLATALSGLGQSWVLSRHFPERGQWALASALGWLVGGMLSQRVLAVLIPDISFTLNLFVFPLIAGSVMGIPQCWVLRRYLPPLSRPSPTGSSPTGSSPTGSFPIGLFPTGPKFVGWWWILASAVGTAVQFPGMVMGGVLIWASRQQSKQAHQGSSDATH